MGCETVDLGDGVTLIACSRGRRTRRSCSVPGCTNAATKQCDFPLGGAKKGKTCDRHLCSTCAVVMSRRGRETTDYCPPHAKQAREGSP